MINREDMLELTRRMTLSRNCIDRMAGAYLDPDGFIDGTFNVNFLNLKAADREKNLAIAKAIPFAETNVELTESPVGEYFKLLEGIKVSGLKNDALLDTFYEIAAEKKLMVRDYGIFLFHGVYDVPRKGTDKEWIEGSEEVYEYLICAICPVTGDYEPGKPEYGFLYPAFKDRSADARFMNVFKRKR